MTTSVVVEKGQVWALSGLRGSGKDTVANYLVSKHGFCKLSFAGKLKDIVSIMFDYSRSMLEGDTPESRREREQMDPFWSERLRIKDISPVKLLQLVGTECFRERLGEDVFVSIVEKQILEMKKANPDVNIVVTDCRFPNEIQMLKSKFNASTIRVYREIPVWLQDVQKEVNEEEVNEKKRRINYILENNQIHKSEIMWIFESFDHTIYNTSCLTSLHKNCDQILDGK